MSTDLFQWLVALGILLVFLALRDIAKVMARSHNVLVDFLIKSEGVAWSLREIADTLKRFYDDTPGGQRRKEEVGKMLREIHSNPNYPFPPDASGSGQRPPKSKKEEKQ